MFSTRRNKLTKQLTGNPKIKNPGAIAKQILQNSTELQVVYESHTFHLNNDKSALYHILNSTDKVEKLVQAVTKQLDLEEEEPKVFFDVGANVGLFSVFVKDHFPDAIIYIFEADSGLIPYIQKNTAGLSDVHIHNAAISDKHLETLKFYRNSDSLQTNSLIKDAVQPFARSIDEFEVTSYSLDGFVSDHSISQVDLIKLDIQGAEYQALQAGKNTLVKCRFLLLEVCFLMPYAIDSLQLAHDSFPSQIPINDIMMGADLLFSK